MLNNANNTQCTIIGSSCCILWIHVLYNISIYYSFLTKIIQFCSASYTCPVKLTFLLFSGSNIQQTFSLSKTDMLSPYSTVSIASTLVLLPSATNRSSISYSSSFTSTSTSDVSNVSSADMSSSISPSFTLNQTLNFQVSYLPTHSSNSPVSTPVSNSSFFQYTGNSSNHLSTMSTISSTQGYVPVFPPTRKISISQGNQSSPHSPAGHLYPCMVLGPGSCCTHALNQIPGDLSFEESEPAGKLLQTFKQWNTITMCHNMHCFVHLNETIWKNTYSLLLSLPYLYRRLKIYRFVRNRRKMVQRVKKYVLFNMLLKGM